MRPVQLEQDNACAGKVPHQHIAFLPSLIVWHYHIDNIKTILA